MSKSVKTNLFVTGVILLDGFIPFTGLPYLERRLFTTLISLIEVGFVFILAKKQNMSLKDMGVIKPKKPTAWIVGILLPLSPAFVVMLLTFTLNSGDISIMFPEKTSLFICAVQTFYYFIIVAPVEEFIFRGFILENFNQTFSKNVSIIFTSLLFAIIHLNGGSIVNLLFAFIISVIFCNIKLMHNNQSLYPCMVGHAINDSLNEWIPYFLF